MHDARARSSNWLETMPVTTLTLKIDSNPVRQRCDASQPTSTQSQVGCSRIQLCSGGTRDCARNHTTQTDATTALRVTITARRTSE